jgi:G3E family GTPase
VYRARRPFDPLKLYRVLEGKFILLQDEVESDDDQEVEDDDEGEETESEASSATGGKSHSAVNSNEETDDEAGCTQIDSQEILANKKACPYFRGLHRSKGIFWLATRPNQMGSWSTAGAMLTLGSELPWFCCVNEEEWMADEATVENIKADFDGEWGDRRQELVFIEEALDTEGLTALFDSCLLTEKEMHKWRRVMQDEDLEEEEKEEKLGTMWDDGYWAEWPRAGDTGEEHDHAHHGHAYGNHHA